jgi:glycosyltransferase involved in cell wall biosynthesis
MSVTHIDTPPVQAQSAQANSNLGVCLASVAFYPLYAGPPTRFQRYAPGLARRGINMHVFTQAVTSQLIARDGAVNTPGDGAAPNAGGSPVVPLYEVVNDLPIQRHPLPEGLRKQPAYFAGLGRYCRERRSVTDVVQFINLDLWAVPTLRQLRQMRVGTVFTHTLLGQLSAQPLKRRLQRFMRRLPLNLADCVVVSSGAMRRQLEDMGVAAPIEIIPNGVDLQRFRPIESEQAKARLRRELGLAPEAELVLAIGPIIPRKGTDALVEAFAALCAQHPRAQLVLVGPRHDEARPELAEFHARLARVIAAAGAQDRVIFTGAVSQVQDYLRAADLLVFPSRREGMPNVIPEAMACGLPVILTPFLGLPEEFGRPGEHYVLSDWAVPVLAADLGLLLSQPERRAALGQSARRWMESNFDVNRSLDAYAALYRRVAKA